MNNQIIRKVLSSRSELAPLLLRIPAGVIFVAHGAQKLFGAFGGYGLTGTGQWMDSVGIHPGYTMALLAGSGEFIGGLGFLFGLFTRPAALMLTVTMLVAIFCVHIQNGLFLTSNGFEYALALLAVSVSVLLTGAGKFALDNVLVARVSPK